MTIKRLINQSFISYRSSYHLLLMAVNDSYFSSISYKSPIFLGQPPFSPCFEPLFAPLFPQPQRQQRHPLRATLPCSSGSTSPCAPRSSAVGRSCWRCPPKSGPGSGGKWFSSCAYLPSMGYRLDIPFIVVDIHQ